MITSPLNNDTVKRKTLTEDDLPKLHHDLMCVYGWIPLNEFKSLSIPDLLKLHKLAQDELKNEFEYKKAVLKGLGHKIK